MADILPEPKGPQGNHIEFGIRKAEFGLRNSELLRSAGTGEFLNCRSLNTHRHGMFEHSRRRFAAASVSAQFELLADHDGGTSVARPTSCVRISRSGPTASRSTFCECPSS